MDSSNLNDVCCICLNKLVEGSECKGASRNLNDNNIEIIERFANAWKEQGSSLYDKCIDVCQKFKEEKWEASFHVKCYRILLSNATYLEECKKKSQAKVEGNDKDETSAAVAEAVPSIPSIRNSTTTISSLQTSDSEIPSCDTDSLPQAAILLRNKLLKLPNGIYKDYTDDPLVYMFFLRLCGDENDIPAKDEELNKKVLFLCQEFATAVHKHKHHERDQESNEAIQEDLLYLAHLVMTTVLSTSD